MKFDNVSSAELILIVPLLALVVGIALLGWFCGFVYSKVKFSKVEEDFACDWEENGYKKKCKIECDWCKHGRNKLDING